MFLHRSPQASGGRNLFLAPDGFVSSAVFGGSGSLLTRGEEVFVYALNRPFIKNKPDALHIATIEELAAIYVGEIKRRQPEDLYRLSGYSVGGVVAYEAARRLLEDGNEDGKLFPIDTACPTFASFLTEALCDFLGNIAHLGIKNKEKNGDGSRGKVLASDHLTLERR